MERITLIVKLNLKLQCLCGYSDAYILASGTITVAALAGGGGNNSILVVFKNWMSENKKIAKVK